MALFDGVENFTPAFTGQQLAIQSGQGAGQSISRGMQTAQRGKALDFQMDTKALDAWAARRKSVLTQSSSSAPAVPWNKMPIPEAMASDIPPAFGGVIGSGGPVGMGVP